MTIEEPAVRTGPNQGQTHEEMMAKEATSNPLGSKLLAASLLEFKTQSLELCLLVLDSGGQVAAQEAKSVAAKSSAYLRSVQLLMRAAWFKNT